MLVIELTTFNTAGNFVFSATLDGVGETSQTRQTKPSNRIKQAKPNF